MGVFPKQYFPEYVRSVLYSKLSQGIDFIGYVLFERYIIIRTQTKHRMKKQVKKALENYLQSKIQASHLDQKLESYLGILSHANQHTLSQAMKNVYWVQPNVD